jgi:hypothetical protein
MVAAEGRVDVDGRVAYAAQTVWHCIGLACTVDWSMRLRLSANVVRRGAGLLTIIVKPMKQASLLRLSFNYDSVYVSWT